MKKEKKSRSFFARLNFLKDKFFYFGFFILLFSLFLNYLVSIYLVNYPTTLPVVYDTILNNIPYYNIGFLYDAFAILCIIVFLIYILFENKEELIGYYMLGGGLFYILRGFFLILTPLGNPTTSYNQLLTGGFFSIGAYPSGHTGAAFLMFLFSKGVYRYFTFLLFLGVIISHLLSRGHYSIDIFSAIIFSYAVYAFCENKLKKYFIKK